MVVTVLIKPQLYSISSLLIYLIRILCDVSHILFFVLFVIKNKKIGLNNLCMMILVPIYWFFYDCLLFDSNVSLIDSPIKMYSVCISYFM